MSAVEISCDALVTYLCRINSYSHPNVLECLYLKHANSLGVPFKSLYTSFPILYILYSITNTT